MGSTIYQKRPPSIFLQGSKEILNGIEISTLIEKGNFSKRSRRRRVVKTSLKCTYTLFQIHRSYSGDQEKILAGGQTADSGGSFPFSLLSSPFPTNYSDSGPCLHVEPQMLIRRQRCRYGPGQVLGSYTVRTVNLNHEEFLNPSVYFAGTRLSLYHDQEAVYFM